MTWGSADRDGIGRAPGATGSAERGAAGQDGTSAGATASGPGPLDGLAQVLAGLPRDAAPRALPQPAELRATGTAADGKVRAEVSAGGRLEALTIDPTLLRGGLVSVADAVLEAVRAAQDEVAARSAEEVGRLGIPAAGELSAAASAAAAGMGRLDEMLGELASWSRRLDGRA